MAEQNLPLGDVRAALAELCRRSGQDFASLSGLIGRNPAYIQQFVRRGTPRRLPEHERRLLARHFGIAESILGGPDATGGEGLVAVPLLAQDADTAARGRIGFARDWLERLTDAPPERLGLVRVEGDSMAPTLNDGDDLLVDRSDGDDRLRDGLYVLRLDDRLLVKRLTLHPIKRRLTVQSDHPAHADWPDVALEEIAVVGRVIWAGRRMN